MSIGKNEEKVEKMEQNRKTNKMIDIISFICSTTWAILSIYTDILMSGLTFLSLMSTNMSMNLLTSVLKPVP